MIIYSTQTALCRDMHEVFFLWHEVNTILSHFKIHYTYLNYIFFFFHIIMSVLVDARFFDKFDKFSFIFYT
jgi:hypothetical protein